MNELKICDLTDLEEAAPRRIEIEGKKTIDCLTK